jgi:hypothetical protein
MHFTAALELRRILNSSYHPFRVIPKPSIWPKRERLKRFTAVKFLFFSKKEFLFSGNMGKDI